MLRSSYGTVHAVMSRGTRNKNPIKFFFMLGSLGTREGSREKDSKRVLLLQYNQVLVEVLTGGKGFPTFQGKAPLTRSNSR